MKDLFRAATGESFSPEEAAHRARYDAHNFGVIDLARAIVHDHPDLLGNGIEDADLLMPGEALPQADAERGTAPVSGMIAAAPTVQIEMPDQTRPTRAGYELIG
ncbi:MAG TPA: hypothetical protein VLG11_01665 [Candidatus Saccharimonadales bacterium]|nr:hypothetical protein [Candidatus Saccharimonadales bacterium]